MNDRVTPNGGYEITSDTWMGILAAAAFVARSKYHRIKGKILGQIVFVRYTILPITHVADWRYICQHKQTQKYNEVIQEYANRINYNYRLGDKVITLTMSVYKYRTPYRGPYEIVNTWKNGTVTLRIGAVTMRINIHNIKPYNTPMVEGQDPT